MTFASLKERLRSQPRKRKVGELYRWLYRNHTELEAERLPGEMWLPYVEIAIEHGVQIGTDKRSIQRVRKTWRMVCLAKAKRSREEEQADRTRIERKEMSATRPVAPSRLPEDWKPEFVEPPAVSEAQPARTAHQNTALTVRSASPPSGSLPKTMEDKIEKARFTLGQAKFDLTIAQQKIQKNRKSGAREYAEEGEASLPGLRVIISERRAILDRLLAGEDVPDDELVFLSPKERERAEE
ncbi:hypothetical protein J2D73_11020 [Acetobacter sacchari]|uniref:Uncharacterized protein n=1 Tax=Acetobacter sacchari TaxID=2661687 RepID=A0ABS3LWM2_9PROT|nr:hypothetical protein [Acetobacter sacchari]MBO1360319.1 hypothetical protein [Acetobacter sacchari]